MELLAADSTDVACISTAVSVSITDDDILTPTSILRKRIIPAPDGCMGSGVAAVGDDTHGCLSPAFTASFTTFRATSRAHVAVYTQIKDAAARKIRPSLGAR